MPNVEQWTNLLYAVAFLVTAFTALYKLRRVERQLHQVKQSTDGLVSRLMEKTEQAAALGGVLAAQQAAERQKIDPTTHQ